MFNPKVSAIEEMKDLDSITMDELHGILTTCEMRIEGPKSKEATFKAAKKKKERENIHYSSSSISSEESYAEIAQFVNKLKRGTGKYKGKLPLKCFRCGKIGHFAAKFSHKHDEHNTLPQRREMNKGKYYKKNNLYFNT